MGRSLAPPLIYHTVYYRPDDSPINAQILVRPGSVPGGARPGGDVSDVLHPEDSNYRKIGALFVKVAREAYGMAGAAGESCLQ